MTKGDAIARMLRWLDEATVNGQPATAEQIADYKDRAAYMLDDVVKFLSGHFKIPAIYTVTKTPEKNLYNGGFEYHAVTPEKPFIVTGIDGARSFYIECQGAMHVDIGGVEFDNEGNGFTAHKGNIPEETELVSLVVTTEFPCVIRNIALFEHQFPTDADVPDYVPWVPYTLPDDFREFDCLLQSADCHAYTEYANAQRQGHKTYLLPYEAQGQFDFHYWRNPETIAPDAPDSTVIEIESKAEQLVPLKLAVDLTVGVDDTATISYYLHEKFNYMMANILTEDKGGRLSIEAVYVM